MARKKEIACPPSTEIEYWKIYAVKRESFRGFWVPGRMISDDPDQVWEVHPQPADPVDEDDHPIQFKCGRELLRRALNMPHNLVTFKSTAEEYAAMVPISKRKSVEERLSDALDEIKQLRIEAERQAKDFEEKLAALVADDARRGRR